MTMFKINENDVDIFCHVFDNHEQLSIFAIEEIAGAYDPLFHREFDVLHNKKIIAHFVYSISVDESYELFHKIDYEPINDELNNQFMTFVKLMT